MQRVTALLCLAVVLVCSTCAAATQGPYMDFLDVFANTKSSKTAFYDGVETETVCMQLTNLCPSSDSNAPCTTSGPSGGPQITCRPYNELQDMACAECHPDGYSSYKRQGSGDMSDMLSSPDTAARCIITAAASGLLDLPDTPHVKIFSTFTAQCLIKDEKGNSCGHPEACDNVIVQITGVIYNIDQAVRVGPPSSFTTCGQPSRARLGRRTAAAQGAQVKGAAASYDGGYDRDTNVNPLPATVPVGPAVVFLGTMTVASRHHPVKFDKGYFQHSYFPEALSEEPVGTVGDLPRFGDDAVKFTFTRERAEY